MSKTAVSYAPRSDVMPESELSALVVAYRFLLHNAKKGDSSPGALDYAKGSKHDSASEKKSG
jgi:hypothetical protein